MWTAKYSCRLILINFILESSFTNKSFSSFRRVVSIDLKFSIPLSDIRPFCRTFVPARACGYSGLFSPTLSTTGTDLRVACPGSLIYWFLAIAFCFGLSSANKVFFGKYCFLNRENFFLIESDLVHPTSSNFKRVVELQRKRASHWNQIYLITLLIINSLGIS